MRTIGYLPDTQSTVQIHAVGVLPFTSATGIKNKLLEAEAMGKSISCTPTALTGLSDDPSFVGLKKPTAGVEELSLLWKDDGERRKRGLAAREWAMACHTRDAETRRAQAAIAEGLPQGGRSSPEAQR